MPQPDARPDPTLRLPRRGPLCAGKWLSAILLALCLATAGNSPAQAQSRDGRDVAGRFDYYVLVLSWAPSWCRSGKDARDSNSCDRGRRAGFVVHGLWPQYERGWPSDCATAEPGPTRRESAAMVDLMGSSGLAWYQWRKHGRCSGLSASDYLATIRAASESIAMPEVFSKLDREVSLPARVVEDAFIEANPALRRDGITVTCQGQDIQEVRICLSKDLSPRACAPDTRRDCSRSMLMPQPR